MRLILPLFLLLGSCTAQQPPNIVLVMADDLGYEALGIYGGLSYKTPNLDSLARGGLRYTHAFSTPLCTPSRVQIMTGKYSFRNYIGFGLLDPSERTLAHYLNEAGYVTGVVGKWQLYGNAFQRELAGRGGAGPHEAGFDEFALWQYTTRGRRFKSPTIHYSDQEPQEYPGEYGPDLFARYAEDFIDRHQSDRFFLYYPMALTHSPFLPVPTDAAFDTLNAATARSDTAYFASNVAYMDAIVGRIADALARRGLDRNTLLLFTADNGTDRQVTSDHESGRIRGRKGFPTAAGTRVALVAYWPGTVRAGANSNALVDFTDFLPTLLDAARKQRPSDPFLDGVSFYGQLTKGAFHERRSMYTHYDPRWGRFEPTRYAQDHEWKLYGDGRFVNWMNDPNELVSWQDSVLREDAALAKKKLQRVLNTMPALSQDP